MALTFRALYKWLLPGNYWAEGTDGEKVLHSLTMVLDAADQIQRDRLMCRFPSYAGDSALTLIGADRGILRGRAETSEHYAARLLAWRYPRGHRVRGNPFAVLEQIAEYFGGGFELRTEQQNGLRFVRAADGTESTTTSTTWDWDSLTNPDATDEWARGWIAIDGSGLITETPDWGDPALYGGQHGDSAYALGHEGVSADDVNAIRKLFRGRAWKPAGTRAMWAVVSLDGTWPTPAGAWGRWATDNAGNYEAARSPDYRYWALDPTALTYAGDPAAYPLSADTPDGGNEGGDPTAFPTSAALVGAAAYGGNPAKFLGSARLVDDGSIP